MPVEPYTPIQNLVHSTLSAGLDYLINTTPDGDKRVLVLKMYELHQTLLSRDDKLISATARMLKEDF